MSDHDHKRNKTPDDLSEAPRPGGANDLGTTLEGAAAGELETAPGGGNTVGAGRGGPELGNIRGPGEVPDDVGLSEAGLGRGTGDLGGGGGLGDDLGDPSQRPAPGTKGNASG